MCKRGGCKCDTQIESYVLNYNLQCAVRLGVGAEAEDENDGIQSRGGCIFPPLALLVEIYSIR
jgi:hypothetical protein